MHAENKTTPHNRTIKFTGLPGGLKELTICVNYVNDNDGNRVEKAVCLDNVVIPAILKAINPQA